MTAIKKTELISVERYLADEQLSDVKNEYIGGYVYAMAGAKNAHHRIAGTFFGLMFTTLRGKPCQPFNTDTKVCVRLKTHSRFYYPDGMVVCEPNSDNDTFQDRPVIIAEVISGSTRRIDETEKCEAYLTISSLSMYLLIEATSPRVAVYRRNTDDFIREQYDGLDAIIPLDVIGGKLKLAEVYERVDFKAALAEDEAGEKIG